MSELPIRFEKHISITKADVVALDILAEERGLSKQLIKQLMQKGAVWQTVGKKTQRLRRAKKLIKTGHQLHLYYDKGVLAMQPMEPELLADEGRYSVWNKPYGMLSQGSKWGDHCTITRWAEQHLKPQRNSFVVHRLDKAANGIILIAHEKSAAAALSLMFQKRQIDKRYRIWVEGQFDKTATQDRPISSDSDIDGRHAKSHFYYVDYNAELNRSLLDVSIETGRKHQIRRHSAELGFPVLGDRLYGSKESDIDLQLCAHYLSFTCPFSGKEKRFEL